MDKKRPWVVAAFAAALFAGGVARGDDHGSDRHDADHSDGDHHGRHSSDLVGVWKSVTTNATTCPGFGQQEPLRDQTDALLLHDDGTLVSILGSQNFNAIPAFPTNAVASLGTFSLFGRHFDVEQVRLLYIPVGASQVNFGYLVANGSGKLVGDDIIKGKARVEVVQTLQCASGACLIRCYDLDFTLTRNGFPVPKQH